MKLSTVAGITAVVNVVFGLTTLLIPAQFLSLYGVSDLPEPGLLMTRFFGSALVGIGALNWFAREDLGRGGAPGAERGIIVGNIVGPGIGLILALWGVLGGILNPFGWTAVGVNLVLVAGWAYFGLLPGSVTDRAPE